MKICFVFIKAKQRFKITKMLIRLKTPTLNPKEKTEQGGTKM